jgi:hypothetical protein
MCKVYDVVKYKTTRVGLVSTVWAIVKGEQNDTGAVAIGYLDIAPSKREVKAILDGGELVCKVGTCTDAKSRLIAQFEKMQKETKEISEKMKNDIDNTINKDYNKEVANKQNKNEKGNETMKKTSTAGKGKTSTAGNVKIVSKVDAFSKTRETEEQMKVVMQPTYAEVVSGSGSKYIVTRESCTCSDHFFRGHDREDKNGNFVQGTVCRHRTAVADVVKAINNSAKYW